MKLNRVTLTYTDELPWDVLTEGPEGVVDAVGDWLDDLLDLEVDDDLGRSAAPSGRRHEGRRGQLSLDRRLRRAEIPFG